VLKQSDNAQFQVATLAILAQLLQSEVYYVGFGLYRITLQQQLEKKGNEIEFNN